MDGNQGDISFKEAVRKAFDTGVVAGLVGAVTTPRGTVNEYACGWRDEAGTQAMGMDTVVAMASMTKTVTAVAAMQLVEQGVIGLDDPLGSLIPHFSAPLVLDGVKPDGPPRLRPARTPVTLRRLLSHCSGIHHETWCAEVVAYKKQADIPPLGTGSNAALEFPLMADPGSLWAYSLGLEWTGKVIEALTGKTLGTYVADHITGPLGMLDTVFGIDPRHEGRVANVWERREDGTLQPIDFKLLPVEYESGGGGLYGSARDYLVFLGMILNQGRHGDTCILRPETVRLMATDQIGDLDVVTMRTTMPHRSNDFEPFFGLDTGWNLGGMHMRVPGPNGRPAGSWGWGGLANCFFWVDPLNEVAGLILSQILPFGDATILDLFGALERDTYRRLRQQEAS